MSPDEALPDLTADTTGWLQTEITGVPVSVGRLNDGRSVIVLGSVLWTDSRFLGDGQANHVVTVTGIAREPYDGALEGFYINDSADGRSAEYVSVHLMTTAFVRTGGFCVVTEIRHSQVPEKA